MIALLSGKLVHKSPEHIIIDVGGIGYRVVVSLQTFYAIPETGTEVSLHIFTYVREDQIVLFGFLTPEEKSIFKRLIGISGIGPKLAINILSGMPADEFVAAVTKEDVARLNAIPGIGRKTADRIIIDLKDKLLKEMPLVATSTTASMGRGVYDDALSALTNLGYGRTEAQKALSTIATSARGSLEAVIKEALKELKG